MRIAMKMIAGMAVLATALLGLMISPGSAGAVTPARAAELQYHVVNNFTAGEIRNSGRFYAKGDAVTYLGKRVKLQRKRPGGDWVTVDRDRADAVSGHFKFKFSDRCNTKFRLVLKASGVYAKTKIKIGRIVCY
ncbi:hypothetical protein ACFFOS_27580 [Nocardioides kongjuensis]|uniref:Uncharacterized protein n=1 Tax=Nocardioides kongjuensis TaxID=349522 RepID=A0A852RCL7_9ACTN|nr:hypothetical protein [Nocardioides kongjuensis]NYD32743.1 hypothetical protein [Nocardioides kongjuensis]